MTLVELARKLRPLIEKAAISLTDDDALEAVELFPAWSLTTYSVGDRIRYEGKLYRCEQAHTAQADWTPDITQALWTEVAPSGTIPEWRQPTGAQDAYMMGDKVRHLGSIWVSNMDFNVYEPSIFGWDQTE